MNAPQPSSFQAAISSSHVVQTTPECRLSERNQNHPECFDRRWRSRVKASRERIDRLSSIMLRAERCRAIPLYRSVNWALGKGQWLVYSPGRATGEQLMGARLLKLRDSVVVVHGNCVTHPASNWLTEVMLRLRSGTTRSVEQEPTGVMVSVVFRKPPVILLALPFLAGCWCS